MRSVIAIIFRTTALGPRCPGEIAEAPPPAISTGKPASRSQVASLSEGEQPSVGRHDAGGECDLIEVGKAGTMEAYEWEQPRFNLVCE